MPFLEMNGVTVPIAVGSASYQVDLLGSKKRSLTGNMLSTSRNAKRVWSMKTTPMDMDLVRLVEAMLNGVDYNRNLTVPARDLNAPYGETFRFNDVDLRGHVGTYPEAGDVSLARPLKDWLPNTDPMYNQELFGSSAALFTGWENQEFVQYPGTMLNPAAGTICFWFYPDGSYSNTPQPNGTLVPIITAAAGVGAHTVSNGLSIQRPYGMSQFNFIVDNAGATKSRTSGQINSEDWWWICFTWKDAEIKSYTGRWSNHSGDEWDGFNNASGGRAALAIANTQLNNGAELFPTAQEWVYVGKTPGSAGGIVGGWHFDELSILPRAITDVEAAEIYNDTAPIDPTLYDAEAGGGFEHTEVSSYIAAQGDVIGMAEITAMGEIDKIDFVTPTKATISFKLHEV